MTHDKKSLLWVPLLLGAIIEFANLQSLFHEFSVLVRPHWVGLAHHGIGAFFALFFIASIIIFGIAGFRKWSWILAGITTVISLFVYRKVAAFDFENIAVTHVHVVVVLIAFVLPMMVAFVTHQIAELINGAPKPMSRTEQTQVLAAEIAAEIAAIKQLQQLVLQQPAPPPVQQEMPHIITTQYTNGASFDTPKKKVS